MGWLLAVPANILSELADSTELRQLSENSQRDVDSQGEQEENRTNVDSRKRMIR